MDIFRSLFEKPKPLNERVKEMRQQLNKETRNIDRQIMNIKREEIKSKNNAKQAAKKNDMVALRIIAKEMVNTKRAVRRLTLTKTHINSVSMSLKLQEAQINITKTFANSTHIMRMMNSLCKVPVISNVMQNMSKEMMKAGLIEETINDAMDDIFDDVGEDEVDEEVNKVVDEMMCSVKGTHVPTNNLPSIDTNKNEINEQINVGETAEQLLEKINAQMQKN
jgi:charged multivesicular body protein 3